MILDFGTFNAKSERPERASRSQRHPSKDDTVDLFKRRKLTWKFGRRMLLAARKERGSTVNTTDGLRRALQINPNGPATAFGDRRRSWRDVGERVARLASGLRSLGTNAGDRVAILSLNSDRYLEVYLATAWAGAVIVPLNIRWSQAEDADALSDCRPGVLLVDKAFASIGIALAQAIPDLKVIYADDGDGPPEAEHYEALLEQSKPIPDAMRAGSDLAGIFYTGGTTGRSKGVMLSHGNLMTSALSGLGEFDGSAADVAIYLHAAPMFHLANAGRMFAGLLGGSSNVMIPSFTPEGVMAAIQKERVTETLLVPTMIQMLVDHPKLGSYELSALTRLTYGASPISEALLQRAMVALPDVQFVQGYGMTELSPTATILHWKEHIGEGYARGRHRSAGRATFCCEVKIVNNEDMPVPPDVVGEIVVRGDNVMMGYWERPDETAKAIIEGWMHTGDSGYMDACGFVFIVDRLKDMIVTGGENVYSIEVENALAQHPGVIQCAVFGIPDANWGEQVHAVVVTRSGAQVSADELIKFCKTRIAGYKCPRSIDISEKPLPLSGAGKVLKRELRKPFWENRERRVS
jgi:long-chain acyl-CoA synthetase